jgi:hypothetical protein
LKGNCLILSFVMVLLMVRIYRCVFVIFCSRLTLPPTVTGLHDMDEYIQAQLLLAVSHTYVVLMLEFTSKLTCMVARHSTSQPMFCAQEAHSLPKSSEERISPCFIHNSRSFSQ